MKLIIAIIIVLLILIILNYEKIRIAMLVTFIVNRGILAPNCFWWQLSDLFLSDPCGIKLFYELEKKYNKSIIKIDAFNKKINVVMDIKYIKIILDNSPDIFAAGKLKKAFFNSFMPKNLGVSSGIEWKNRRKLNEHVLFTNKFHEYLNLYNNYTENYLQLHFPNNFSEFNKMAAYMVGNIIFADPDFNAEILNIFHEANSLNPVIFDSKIKLYSKEKYDKYLYDNIKNPRKNSLVALAKNFNNDTEEIYNQIPHWMFPIAGLYNAGFPRMLCLLINNPEKLAILSAELKTINSLNEINNSKYIRYCILETLRLNNPVITLFRTLTKKYTLDKEYQPGEQFLILTHPILRNSETFPQPYNFIPERWSDTNLENSYYSIMFNQGPQKCPGKNLSLSLLTILTYHYLKNINIEKFKCSLNFTHPPDIINPCSLSFFPKKLTPKSV